MVSNIFYIVGIVTGLVIGFLFGSFVGYKLTRKEV